jgi:hypothetical protein
MHIKDIPHDNEHPPDFHKTTNPIHQELRIKIQN